MSLFGRSRAHARWSRLSRRVLAPLAVVAVSASLVGAVPPPASAAAHSYLPPAPKETPIPFTKLAPTLAPTHRPAPVTPTPRKPPVISWPAAGDDTVTLTASSTTPNTPQAATSSAAPSSPAPTIRAGKLPVLLGAATTAPASKPSAGQSATASPAPSSTSVSVHVHVADQADAHKAGVDGLLFSIAPSTAGVGATVPVGVDYSAFRDAGGADWSMRLHLVELPACALTTPAVRACQTQTAVPASTDNTTTHVVSAPVPLSNAAASQKAPSQKAPSTAGTLVLAAVAGPAGSNGTFEASSLKPSGSWSVAGNSGDFTWSYPIAVPPVASGTVAPSIALSYDSQSVDGETAGTNTQTSALGEGWGYQPGYIERTYRTCSSDTDLPSTEQTGDQCWAGQIVTMSLNGQSTAVVHQDGAGLNDGWHPASDNGDNVQLLGQADENRNYAGEYWEVTTTDGTHYFFGRQTGPGYTNQTRTNSVETEPVYGAHSGDPCYQANNFAGSSCTQAWRWNLDYVEDPHGNVTMYYYTPETNYYGAEGKTTGVSYTRADTLSEVDYGLRDENGTVYGSIAPDRVQFNTIQRCDYTKNSCDPSQFTAANASQWPDTPQDQQCLPNAVCNNHAPSFWSVLRLGSITTEYANGSGGYVKVDNYALTQQFPGDADEAMVLQQIQRTGYAADGTAITTPPVTFDMQMLDNRVDGYHGLPGMARYRMTIITEDTGEKITIDYSPPQCTATTVPTDPSHDSMYCFPVMWTPDGGTGQTADYYHKYVTKEVDITDGAARSPEEITQYRYPNPPAWHYDDNEIVKPVDRTYGQFRGFSEVDVLTGNTQNSNAEKVPDQLTETKTSYFTGMDGDTLPNGATRSASVTNFLGETVPDNNLFAGTAYETQTLNGVNGPEVSAEITNPVLVATTATRARTGLPALTATIVSTAQTRHITDLAAGGTTTTSKTYTYNDRGLAVQETDSATGLPDLCTTTSYADNTTTWVRDKVDETIVSQQTCPTAGAMPAPILSDNRTYYDSSDTLGTITLGDATRLDTATADTNGTLTFATTSTATFDASGRPLSTTSHNTPGDTGNTATIAYTPADGGNLTQTVTTNAKQQTTTAVTDPGRGVTTHQVDIAGNITDATYDALGRLTAEWLPKQSKTDGSQASITYSYLLQATGPQTVTTHTLVDRGEGVTDYTTSIKLYDSYGQLVQTQAQAEGGYTDVTDTFYDSHGWSAGTYNGYYIAAAPATSLVVVNQSEVDDRTITTYDDAGRAIGVTNYKNDTATDTTQTIYGGDRTTVIPPAGGVSHTTLTDARGHTSELRQYTAPPTIAGSVVSGGSYTSTDYGYTALGQQNKITDPDGNQWSYSYDMQGRQLQATDPDTGQSTYSYDLAGNLRTSTDARGQTLAYTYDPLNRKTGEYSGSTSGPELASWTYDTVQKGKLTQSIRYTPQGKFLVGVAEYDQDGNPGRYYVDVPSTVPGLAGYYQTSYTYTSTDQVLNVEPADGGSLPSDDIVNTYDALGNLTGSSDDSGVYLNGATYTPFNEPNQYVLGLQGLGAGQASLTFTRDPQTHRLTNTNFSANQATPQLDSTTDTYDPSGNLTSSSDVEGPAGSATQTQCNNYNTLDQLTGAWTATDNCANPPTTEAGTANVGGVNPFWESWTLDPTGLRKTQTIHALPGASGGDTTTTDTYPAPGSPQADTLSATSTTGPTGTTSSSYSYDPSGNTTARTLTGSQQTLTWDAENHLATDTTVAGTSSYIYDADGNLLLTQDATSATLYLPGEELAYDNATQAVTGTRFYTANGQTIAERTGRGDVEFLDGDQHNTMDVVYDPTAQTLTRRAFDPYGNQVGPTTTASSTGTGTRGPGSWPDLHAFLNDPIDPSTGLTSIGARDYDTATGRFISVDPKLNASDPQSLTGYAYADDNPTTNSDPTGLCATMDGPSQGHPVCAPKCVLMNDCGSAPLPPPAQAGASTPAHAEWAPASNPLDRPVLGHQPNKWQLAGMRAHGYQGIDEFTWADAQEWLRDSDPENQNYAWEAFCRAFEQTSSSSCASMSFSGWDGIAPWTPGGGVPDAAHTWKAIGFAAGALVLGGLIDAAAAAGTAAVAGVDAGADAIAAAVGDDAAGTAGPGLLSRALSAASRVTSGARAVAGKAWDLTYGSLKTLYNSTRLAPLITRCTEEASKAYLNAPSIPGVSSALPAVAYAAMRCFDAVFDTNPYEGFIP